MLRWCEEETEWGNKAVFSASCHLYHEALSLTSSTHCRFCISSSACFILSGNSLHVPVGRAGTMSQPRRSSLSLPLPSGMLLFISQSPTHHLECGRKMAGE